MNLADVLPDLGRPLVVYPSLARLLGLKQAAFLCNFFYWTGKQHNPEGWIYKTVSEIESETGLTRHEQQVALRDLKRSGIIEDRYHRLQHRKEYRVNAEHLGLKWAEASLKAGHPESHGAAAPKAANRLSYNEAPTLTTTLTSTPIGNNGKAVAPRKANWAGDQFPKVALLCPTLDTAEACKMLNALAKAHGGRNIVEEALARLKGPLAQDVVWGALRNSCKRTLEERAGKPRNTVSELFHDPTLNPEKP